MKKLFFVALTSLLLFQTIHTAVSAKSLPLKGFEDHEIILDMNYEVYHPELDENPIIIDSSEPIMPPNYNEIVDTLAPNAAIIYDTNTGVVTINDTPKSEITDEFENDLIEIPKISEDVYHPELFKSKFRMTIDKK